MSIKRKAQVFTTDVVISLVIFLVITSMCFYLWDRTYDRSAYFSEHALMKQKLFQVTDLMIRTSGYPENWDTENVRIVGFSSKDHVLQKNKVNEFMNLSENEVKDVLKTRNYNFYFNLSAQDLTFIKGSLWDADAETVLSQSRGVLINDSNKLKNGVLRFYLWN